MRLWAAARVPAARLNVTPQPVWGDRPFLHGGPDRRSIHIVYLKALANRAGQTFIYPTTSREASKQIQRLKTLRPSSRFELAVERVDIDAERAAREANCDVPVDLSEIEGYGSNCRWSH